MDEYFDSAIAAIRIVNNAITQSRVPYVRDKLIRVREVLVRKMNERAERIMADPEPGF